VHDLAAATFVPFNDDGSVNLAGVDAHAKDLADHGVMFAFSESKEGSPCLEKANSCPSPTAVNGTTGDSMCLREIERKELASAWVAARAKYGVKVINHIGSASLSEVKELARHSAEIGCDALCIMPPTFFKPRDAAALAKWVQETASAAPKLPLYYYNFPAITGVEIRPDHLLAAIEEIGVPSFRGMKFTDFNLWWYSNCIRNFGGKYDMAYGRDEQMLGGLATGALGSIGNGFNFAAGTYQRIRKAFFAGDLKTAQEEQHRANISINIMNDARFGGNGLATSRVMYEMKGAVKLGPPVAPIVPLTAAQKVLLKEELDRVGFFTWCD
jgi:N-acetylneuraminate lyase